LPLRWRVLFASMLLLSTICPLITSVIGVKFQK